MTTDLIILDETKLPQLFVMNGLDEFISKVKSEVLTAPKDISTEKGRKEIASLAYKIAKSKTEVEKLGKRAAEDAENIVKAIRAERQRGVAELQALQDEIRAPLTEWEEADKTRQKAHQDAIDNIKFLGTHAETNWDKLDIPALEIGLEKLEKTERNWDEFKYLAQTELTTSIEKTKAAIERRKKHDADAAELIRLREESAARERKEREDKIAAEAAEKARIEAEKAAESARLEAEAKAKAEADRIEREKQEAIERAEKAERDRIAAEKAAIELAAQVERDKVAAAEKAEADRLAAIRQAELDAIERQKAADALAEKVAADKLAAEQKAEADRIAAVAAEKKRQEDEAAAIAAETAKREKDKSHKSKINNEALAALIAAGATEELGKKLIVAIAKGEVPHVKINY